MSRYLRKSLVIIISSIVCSVGINTSADLVKAEEVKEAGAVIQTIEPQEPQKTEQVTNSTGEAAGEVAVQPETKPASEENASKEEPSKEAGETQKKEDPTITALNKINQGSGTLEDYKTLNIEKVTSENFAKVQTGVKSLKEAAGRDLTKEDIVNVVNNVVLLNEKLARVKDGQATLQDYLFLSVRDITADNLAYVNKKLAGKEYEDVNLLIADAEKAVSDYKIFTDPAIYEKINKGDALLSDYEILNITDVDRSNLAYVNADLKYKRYKTAERIQERVNSSLESYSSLAKVNAGAATVDDYWLLGIEGVNEANYKAVNADLKGKNYLKITEIQARVTASTAVYAALVNVNAGNASITNFTTLGVSGITAGNRLYANSDLKGKNYTLPSEVKARAASCLAVYNAMIRVNAGTCTAADYKTLGLGAISTSTDWITRSNAATKGKKYTLLSQVQAALRRNVALVRMNAGNAIVDDYTVLDITTIDSTYLPYSNADLKGKNYTSATQAQTRVGGYLWKYNVLIRMNAGIAALSDYTSISSQYVTAANLPFVNADMRGKNYRTSAQVVARINAYYLKYNSLYNMNCGRAPLENYTTLGVKNVTAANLPYVNADLKGKGYKSLTEVQAKVNADLGIYGVLGRMNLGTATVADYTKVGITSVNAVNLIYVNADLKNKKYTLTSTAADRINSRQEVYNRLIRTNAGTALLSDYTIIGITTINESNLAYVNADLKGKKYVYSTQITNRICDYINKYNSLARIKNGNGILANYNTLGIINVTASNLAYVNADLKGNNYVAASAVASRINANLAIYNSLIKVNAGTAAVNDYKTLGITTVIASNLKKVNAALKNKGLKTAASVRNEVGKLV